MINSANKAVKTGLSRNASTASSFAGSRSQLHMKSQARMLSQASLMNLSGIDLVSSSGSMNSVGSADGADALETSFKIVKTNKFGVKQERILEFVPLKASERKDVTAEGGMEMRVSTLRGEKKKGFDVDFMTSLVKDKSDDHKLTIMFGAPFYYSMLKTLAYMEEDAQRPYLLEFRESDARESFCKTLLWAQNSSRESYRAHEYQKKMERLRDMNTTLWNCSYKGKTHRWEPHELYWRAASGVVHGRIAVLNAETQDVAIRFNDDALKRIVTLDEEHFPSNAPEPAVACVLVAEHNGKSRNINLVFIDAHDLASFILFARKNSKSIEIDDDVTEIARRADEEDDGI